ncbi:MAG TPA: hypothetical protein VKS79_01160 [Gemmataceae bacterium]|nr:hypothetical protein [Gemmataceae bacterium]
MRASIALSLAIVPIALAMLAFAGEDKREDPAAAAARKRQELIKTLDVRFKHTETYAKGAVPDASRSNPNPSTPVPPEDMSVESINRIVINGENVRIEDNHPGWYDRGKRIYKQSMIYTFDGNTGYMLVQSEYGGKPSVQGGMERGFLGRDVHFIPLYISVRGLSPMFSSPTMAQLQPSGTTERIGDEPCEQYAVPTKSGSPTLFWLDAKRDFCLRRIRSGQEEQNHSVYNIQNRYDEKYGWLPKSWSHEEHSWKGKLLATHTIEIQEMKIDEPVPAELFRIDFPPGSMVADNRSGHQEYVVQSDGGVQEDDLASHMPAPAKKTWFPPTLWIASAAALLLIIVLAIVFVRRGNSR